MTIGDPWLADPNDPHSDAFTLGERAVREAYFNDPIIAQMIPEVTIGEVWYAAGKYSIEHNIPAPEIEGFKAGVRSALRARLATG